MSDASDSVHSASKHFEVATLDLECIMPQQRASEQQNMQQRVEEMID